MTTLSITEVCRRTGLSTRALRFYEVRGLVSAQRTAAGKRRYGAGEVARLHHVTAFKRAGFSLKQIAALTGAAWLDLDGLIAAQIAELTARRTNIDDALAGLRATQAALTRGEPIDLDTFCTLIKQGEKTMTDETSWKKVADRFYSQEEQARWREKMNALPTDFDPAAYQAKWTDLGGRIAADLPMDPTSDAAQAYLAEWNALLTPFNMAADARMKTETVAMYDRMDEWSGDASPGFTKAVWDFIKTAAVALVSALGTFWTARSALEDVGPVKVEEIRMWTGGQVFRHKEGVASS